MEISASVKVVDCYQLLQVQETQPVLSTGCEVLDTLLAGGIRPGCLYEVLAFL